MASAALSLSFSRKKNLPFRAWSQEGLGFFPLTSEERGTGRQDIAHSGWKQATRAAYHLPPDHDSEFLS